LRNAQVGGWRRNGTIIRAQTNHLCLTVQI
jgi:hypothetical protein